MQSWIPRKSTFRQIGFLSIALLIFFAYGCSRTQFAYRNADWLLEAYAAKTLAASDEQIEQWRPTLSHTLEIHQRELLPLIIDYLDLLDRASRFPEDTIRLDCTLDAGIYLYERHAQLAVDLAIPLLASLDSSQVRYLAESLAKDQEKLRKQFLKDDPEDQHNARVERFIAQTEKWTGTLNDKQVHVLDQAVRSIPDLSELWLDYRAQQIRGLLDILEAGPDTTPLRQHLNGWWVRLDHRSPEYVRDWNAAKQGFNQFLQQLLPTLTAKQQTRIHTQITALRRDLEALLTTAPQPGNPPEMFLCFDESSRDQSPDANIVNKRLVYL